MVQLTGAGWGNSLIEDGEAQKSRATKVGEEDTSSYGTGLARFLRRHGVEVVEVDRQNRQSRRNQGKSDPLDAVEAARAAIREIVKICG